MSHGSDLFQGCIDNGENANINHFSTKSEVLTKKNKTSTETLQYWLRDSESQVISKVRFEIFQ